MSYDNKKIVDKTFDKNFIKVRQNSWKKNKIMDNDTKKDFCYKMYNDWVRKDSPVDIPVLIMDNDNLLKNKDVDIIPRLYSKYAQKNIYLPFIFVSRKNKYSSFKKYFRALLNKDIPTSTDFKNLLIQKKDFDKNQNLFESINVFLYTSFLLKQFAAVMNIIPHFYSPISDETKYYFYILFDYMRRECIRFNKPLMKNDVIELIKKLASLENKVLTKVLFLNTFEYIDEAIFNPYVSFNLITENKVFNFSLIKDTIDTNNYTDADNNIIFFKNIVINNVHINNNINNNNIFNNNKIMNNIQSIVVNA